ncbi:hypothetical protein GII33_20770 [Gordonia pseudamarae]|uniref:hypothetical protein n=1 Tax=Gordonia TaxID=2053 RepID=UPI0019A19106|nr:MULTISPECIES: hypothetical protein [Gordonia]MBD0021939.1 hypothetical protein [Gordonia sp. (in: high G+C Gram-positive bacteria)]QHN28044.1 hypothetical protein GII33_20770 [Gordonia pseudamarae]
MTSNLTPLPCLTAINSTAGVITVRLDAQHRGVQFEFTDGRRLLLPWEQVSDLCRYFAAGWPSTYEWSDDDGAPVLRISRVAGRRGTGEHTFWWGERGRPTVVIGSAEMWSLVTDLGRLTLADVLGEERAVVARFGPVPAHLAGLPSMIDVFADGEGAERHFQVFTGKFVSAYVVEQFDGTTTTSVLTDRESWDAYTPADARRMHTELGDALDRLDTLGVAASSVGQVER